MNPDARRYISVVLFWTIAAILATALVTKPGYTSAGIGRASDVDRYFGWPAEYYADTWNAESPNAPSPGFIAVLPIPPAGMDFSYSDFDIRALTLNVVFICCLALLAVLLGFTIDRQRISPLVGFVAAILAGTALTLFFLADSVGAAL